MSEAVQRIIHSLNTGGRHLGDMIFWQLADAAVAVHTYVARGMVHGHLGRGPSLKPVAETLDFFAAALLA